MVALLTCLGIVNGKRDWAKHVILMFDEEKLLVFESM